MRSLINRFTSRTRATAITTATTRITPPTAEHFQPVLDEVRSFGTQYIDVLRPAFTAYQDATLAPLVEAEKQIMASSLEIEGLCHELAAIAPDLIRTARGDHPLNIPELDIGGPPQWDR